MTAAPLTNILIVDDEPANLLVLETVLDDPGYRIVRAQSAEQALRALMADEFAVLVLDIQLPDMNGFEVLARLREDPALSRTPVVAVSANALQRDIDAALAAGFTAYITKPVVLEDLLDIVQQSLAEA